MLGLNNSPLSGADGYKRVPDYPVPCFNVDEVICGLKKVDFDNIQEEYNVQLCTVVKDCDVENQFCEDKDVVINDVTCKETSEFVCTKQPTEDY